MKKMPQNPSLSLQSVNDGLSQIVMEKLVEGSHGDFCEVFNAVGDLSNPKFSMDLAIPNKLVCLYDFVLESR